MFCLEVFPCWAHHRSANTSVELSCLHNGIMRNILSKTLCSFDFTPSDLLGASCKFCCLPTALLRVPPDQHFCCLLGASLWLWDAPFDIPWLSYGNESSWNGLLLSLAMFPSCLPGRFLYRIAPGALQRLLWSLKSLRVPEPRKPEDRTWWVIMIYSEFWRLVCFLSCWPCV